MLTLILATQDKTVHLDAITPALAAAAVVAALAWLLLLAIFAVATRPKQVEAAAPTMDLGPEAPALVDYLVNHCRSTTHAEAATLLDLAARHYLAIDDREDDDTVCRLGVTPPNDLNDYERMLFDHVAQQAAKGPVPTRALTTGTAAQSAAWHQRFERLVMQDARGRGLSVDRLSLGEWTIVRLAGLAAAALVVVIAAQANAIQFGIFGVALAGVGAHTVVMKLLGSQRLTDSGVAATSHWLGVRAYIGGGEGFHDLPAGSVVLWDRYMAYACALGLARAAMRSLPLGVEDEHTAWSHYGGGEWHSVKVSYPHNHLVWGRTPLGVVSMGLMLTALGGAGVYGGIKIYALPTAADGAGITHWIHVVALAMGAGGMIAAAWGLYTMRLGFQDFGPRRDVEGEAVRCRSFRRGNDKGVDYFVAVDDGKQQRIRAWLVDSAQYGSVQEGCVIHASVSATQAHVYDLSVVTPAARDVYTPAPLAGAATAAAAPLSFVTLAAAALGTPMATGTAVALPDPTSMISADDVTRVLGQPYQPAQTMPVAASAMQMRACRYAAVSGKGAVSVILATGPFMALAGKMASRFGKAFELAGRPAMLHGNTIALPSAQMVLAIRLDGVEPPDAALQTLATIAAGRLPQTQAAAPA